MSVTVVPSKSETSSFPFLARRIVSFGRAAYPELMRSDPLAVLAQTLVAARGLSVPVLSRVGPPLLGRQLDQKSVIRRALHDTSPATDPT